LGQIVHAFAEVGSTNTVLAVLAQREAPQGTMVIADYQSHGRGRRQRRWEAPPRSSLLLSLLFRPDWPAVRASWLTMIAGLAAVDAMQTCTPLQAALKWPNDVMIWDTAPGSAGWCKVGGLLLETRLDGDQLRQAIIGIGLNVNIPRDQLPQTGSAGTGTPAGSLLATSGQYVPRLRLLTHFLQRLETLYERAAAGQSPQPAWDARLLTRDQPVRVTGAKGIVEGTALGSDEWGRLLVRAADGELHRFAAGDVTLGSYC
jgi:BirA family biotin operon repressor/biotin-[acetyl-CoA-carboxylase] ligase